MHVSSDDDSDHGLYVIQEIRDYPTTVDLEPELSPEQTHARIADVSRWANVAPRRDRTKDSMQDICLSGDITRADGVDPS